MSLIAWLEDFHGWHAKARNKELRGEEMGLYLAMRDELARMLLGAQQLLITPGQMPRRALRVSRVLPLELTLSSGVVRGNTLDVSAGGFAVVLEAPVAPGTPVPFELTLPEDAPIRGNARVVASKHHGMLHRVAFTFHDIPEPDHERLEFLVFDSVLEIMSS